MTDIIPLDKLEQLRREQGKHPEPVEQRPALYAPEPMEVLSSGSVPHERIDERGVTIIDFTI